MTAVALVPVVAETAGWVALTAAALAVLTAAGKLAAAVHLHARRHTP